jgi:hypothetical protein
VAAGSSWAIVDVGGSSDYYVYGLAAVGANVYASTDKGVFNVGTGAALGGAPASSEALFAAGGYLFLSRHVVDSSDPVISTYTLYRFNGATFNQIAAFAPAADMSIRGVAFDGTYYYFAAENLLVRANDQDGSGAVTIPLTKTVWSASSAASGAYIGTTDGYLYRYVNGTQESVAASSIPLTCVAEVPLTLTTRQLLVGTGTTSASTDPNGYLESNTDVTGALASMTFPSGENGIVATSSSVYATTVGNLPVNALLYDSATGTLLIGLSAYTSTGVHYGLYSSVWSGSSWSGWKAE